MFVAMTILRTPGGGLSKTSLWFTVGIKECRGTIRSLPSVEIFIFRYNYYTAYQCSFGDKIEELLIMK
jgi:hypothetical protein